jgi:hypothetical protein
MQGTRPPDFDKLGARCRVLRSAMRELLARNVRVGSFYDIGAALADVRSWGNPRHTTTHSSQPLIYLTQCGRVTQGSQGHRLVIAPFA